MIELISDMNRMHDWVCLEIVMKIHFLRTFMHICRYVWHVNISQSRSLELILVLISVGRLNVLRSLLLLFLRFFSLFRAVFVPFEEDDAHPRTHIAQVVERKARKIRNGNCLEPKWTMFELWADCDKPMFAGSWGKGEKWFGGKKTAISPHGKLMCIMCVP